MSMLSTKALRQRIESMARQFHGDRRGLAAVEFALIVPLMLVLVFGMIETTNGVAVNRKVYLVARTLSDMTSRAASLNSTDVSSFFTVGGAIMQPYASGASVMSTTISQVYVDPATSIGRVKWSQGTNKKNLNDPVTVPTGLISKDSSGNVLANQYLIYSEVSYKYTPAVGYLIRTAITLSDATFTRPRQSDKVDYTP